MKELQKELKEGILQHAYLLHGEEAYLKRQYESRIKKACIEDDDTINFHQYEGKGIDVQEVISMAMTVPFFAPKRLLLLRDTGWFKSACDDMADYIANVPDTACMVFVEDDIDKRTRMYKAVKKYGRIVEFKAQSERTLTTWIVSLLKKEGRQITAKNLQLFLEKTGTDMDNIYQELEKLVCYTYGRDVITGEDIENVCSVRIENQIFDMINAMAEKQSKRALELYYNLLALKEAPMKILALINRQFHLLMQVKDLARIGKDKKEIASQAGIPPFFAGRYIAQARGFTMEQLRSALEDGVQAEEDVKTGRMADKLSVELLIVKYSRE